MGRLSFAALSKGRKAAMVKCTPVRLTAYVFVTSSASGAQRFSHIFSKGRGCDFSSLSGVAGPEIPELQTKTSM